MAELAEAFKSRIRSQIEDAEFLFEVLDGESPTTVRIHPRKTRNARYQIDGRPVLWNEQGRYLSSRPRFASMPAFHAGLFYPMEASSMFLGHVLKQIELPENAIILDLCGAPGGKTLMLKDQFPYNLLVSNEIDGKRVHVLRENSIRWGTDEHIAIQSDAARLAKSGLTFDLILVDAPCSGEGLFRKDPESRAEWTPGRADGCATRQQQILEDIAPMVAEGGIVIYSTCTYNPGENMEQVSRFAKNNSMVSLEIGIEPDWNIEVIRESDYTGYQFWPHRLEGEGFFLSVLKDRRVQKSRMFPPHRADDIVFNELPGTDLSDFYVQQFDDRYFALTTSEVAYLPLLSKCGKIVKRGVFLGETKGRDFIPSHDLAMHQLSEDYPVKIDLDDTQAQAYLRGEALHIPSPKGPVLLTHQGLSLGFGKSNGSRINNQYPKALRSRY